MDRMDARLAEQVKLLREDISRGVKEGLVVPVDLKSFVDATRDAVVAVKRYEARFAPVEEVVNRLEKFLETMRGDSDE
jgi:hypothetical protein